MEQRRSILDRLSEIPASEVRSELAEVRRERERLESLERVLQNLLEFAEDERPNPIDIRREATPARAAADSLVADGAETQGRGANRRAILAVLATDPTRAWAQREVREQLQQRGVEMTPENLRVTMRRMAEKGELLKPTQGRFKLPVSPEGDD